MMYDRKTKMFMNFVITCTLNSHFGSDFYLLIFKKTVLI